MFSKLKYWLVVPVAKRPRILGNAGTIGYWLLANPLYAANHDFGLEETARAANLPRTGAGPAAVAGVITGYLLAFVGVIFFVLMLYGGIRWMTARGNEEQIKKAQELIKSAVIGVVIIFLSYVLTRFVIRNLIEATSQ